VRGVGELVPIADSSAARVLAGCASCVMLPGVDLVFMMASDRWNGWVRTCDARSWSSPRLLDDDEWVNR
jgi:hypothetical protein